MQQNHEACLNMENIFVIEFFNGILTMWEHAGDFNF